MLAYYAMCAVLILIAAGTMYGMVQAGGFWGALIMAGVFAAIMAAAANCPT